MKQGRIRVRINERFSVCGRTLSYEMLDGPNPINQCYGVGVDHIIPGLSRNNMGEGAEYEITARLIKSGKAGNNPFKKRQK